MATQHSKKGFGKGSGNGSGEGFTEGSEKGACYGFHTKKGF